MNHIKVIKTDQEHEAALARLMELMDAAPIPDSAKSDELEVLAVLIERYEQEKYPIDLPDPIEAIKFRMEQQGLRQKDLAPYIGSASKVSEVLSGSRKLSLSMIRKLSEGLGIPADVLIREPEQQVASNNDIEWYHFPLNEMCKRGYFEGFSKTLAELKEYAAEYLTHFLSSVPSGLSLRPAMLRTSANIQSNSKEMDSYALWAWQVRVLQKAQEEQLPVNYVKGTVDLELMSKVVQLSWSEKGPLLAKEFLNRHGVHLIFEPHLPKTYLDGAVCLTSNGNPVVALTLRHDRIDNFWFSLLHELAHIALHIDGSKEWFIDDLDAVISNEQEQQADELAQKALIPAAVLSTFICHDAESVRQLAKTLNISPCIIAGRLRHETGDHQLFGSLFRDKVRAFVESGCSH